MVLSPCAVITLQVIYFGDNLWADAWPSSLAGWDSVLILEEMDAEGYAVSDGTVPGHEDEKQEDPDKPPLVKPRRYEVRREWDTR